MKKKWIIAAACTLVLLVMLVLAGGGFFQRDKVRTVERHALDTAQAQPWSATDEGYQPVATTGQLTLYVDAETADFYVETSSGARWFQSPEDADTDRVARGVYKTELTSALVVQYYDLERNSVEKKNTQVACVSNGTFELKLIDGGFLCEYTFEDAGITIPLEVSIAGDQLRVRVVTGAIREENPERYRLRTIRMLPNFGAAGLEDVGYVMVPDGSGALMRFNNGKYQADDFVMPLYGENASGTQLFQRLKNEGARLPVFGISKNGTGFLAVVAEGDAACAINAYTNLRNSNYGGVYAEFTLRSEDAYLLDYESLTAQTIRLYQLEDMELDACEVVYCFLPEDAADYNGMAARYRQYLLEEQQATLQAAQTPILLDYYCAVSKTKPFLGIPIARTQVLSSLEEVQAAYGALAEDIPGLSLRLMNWSKAQVKGRIDATDDIASGVGTWEQMETLGNLVTTGGGLFALEAELVRFSKGGAGIFTLTDAAEALSGSPAYQYQYRQGTRMRKEDGVRGYLLKADRLAWAADSLRGALEGRRVAALSPGTLGNLRYGSYGSEMLTTAMTMTAQVGAARALAEDYTLVLDNPYVDAALTAALLVDVPMESSHYLLMDENIPFVQMALGGIARCATVPINLEASSRLTGLEALATGSALHYALITGDTYLVQETDLNGLYSAGSDIWADQIRATAEEAMQVWTATQGSALTRFEWLSDEVSRSVFGNGTELLVNYGAEATTVMGQNIPAMSWLIREVSTNE